MTKYADLKIKGSDLPRHNLSNYEMLKQNVPKMDLLAAVLYTSGSTGVPKGTKILSQPLSFRSVF